MKKTSQTRTRRSYRLIGGMTFLSLVISVLCGVFVSFDACLSAVFGGITVITLGAIMRAAVESAAELRRERTEAGVYCSIIYIEVQRTFTILTHLCKYYTA